MKKNLTKLALSGAALAAVAATLGTSTYAWYTTNPTVTANNINAGTSDSGSSSIFISKDSGTPKSWGSSVTLTAADFVTAPSLTPLSYASAGEFSELNTTTGDLDTAGAPGAAAAKITLYFKSSKVAADNAQSIYIRAITVANTTGVTGTTGDAAKVKLPTADNLVYNAEADAATIGGVSNHAATYSVDFRNALSMAVYNAASSNGFDAAYSIAAYQSSATYLVNPTVTSGAAQAYYNAVMENDLTGDAVTAAPALAHATNGIKGQAIGVCPTNGSDYITVDFYFYLDGASEFCYDACQGQNFSINLTFTSDETQAIGYTSGN